MKQWESSKYIGVVKQQRKSKNNFTIRYIARFKKHYLGSFKNEIDAAMAYDKKAKKHKRLKLNFTEIEYSLLEISNIINLYSNYLIQKNIKKVTVKKRVKKTLHKQNNPSCIKIINGPNGTFQITEIKQE